MPKQLCIHGHFYQPPREDPWLNAILPEGSAAPWLDWNQRITRESYAPLARARRLDGSGNVREIMNCYEWMSFNVGPTLFSWLALNDPETTRLMAEADASSLARLGHGNALAQVYHHQILPLASPLDKELEVAWAVEDFKARFGRAPEGMWLSETAVDTPTLEVLARFGLAFTILAPSQAKATAGLDGQDWTPAGSDNLDIRRPYLVRLPSGRSLAVFFYDGPLSQAVAFERLLGDGEGFWRRLSQAASPGLLALATDGETYGHHFKFGEMALAFVLDQARNSRDGLSLTNFAAYLAGNPPTRQVRLHEPSAWSCAHGVERWRSDCGCTTGGHPGWHQRWRAPLRQGLALCKDLLDKHYFGRGGCCLIDPKQALVDYGQVLAQTLDQDGFAKKHFQDGLNNRDQEAAWKLLAMQQWGLASMASCAWFFDEISRIEPVNGLTFALRAMELARDTGAADIEAQVLPILAKAESNLTEFRDGGRIWQELVKPRQETPGSMTAQALLTLWGRQALPGPGASAQAAWPGVRVEITAVPKGQELSGTARIHWNLESGFEDFGFTWKAPLEGDPLAQPVVVRGQGRPDETFSPRRLPVNKRQALADALVLHGEEKLWAQAGQAAASMAHMVCEIQEAQTTLTLAQRWSPFWSGLAWSYVWGLDLPAKSRELLLMFLAQARPDKGQEQILAERLVGRVLQMIEEQSPDWPALSAMAIRAREISLGPDWWAVQNRLWDMRHNLGPGQKFAAKLGLAL